MLSQRANACFLSLYSLVLWVTFVSVYNHIFIYLIGFFSFLLRSVPMVCMLVFDSEGTTSLFGTCRHFSSLLDFSPFLVLVGDAVWVYCPFRFRFVFGGLVAWWVCCFTSGSSDPLLYFSSSDSHQPVQCHGRCREMAWAGRRGQRPDLMKLISLSSNWRVTPILL